MDEETFNIQVRKFLKKVGISSQREIENAVRKAISSGNLNNDSIISAKMTLQIEELNLTAHVEEKIKLS